MYDYLVAPVISGVLWVLLRHPLWLMTVGFLMLVVGLTSILIAVDTKTKQDLD